MALACLSALDASHLRAQNNGVVFGFQMGYKAMAGDLGQILDGGIVGEYDFSYHVGKFRYGIGFNLVSLDVAGFDESVSQVNAYLSASWFIKQDTRVRPYLQVRIGGVRYRPEGDTFAPPEPEADEEGENAADAVDGFEGGLLGGAEFAISSKFAVDLSGGFSFVSTEEVDLTAIGLEPVKRGTTWTVRLGARWNP
jgi:opacity protein-like surface antigen